jgi:hypothetical protein
MLTAPAPLRRFTREDAERTLPLVQRIARDLIADFVAWRNAVEALELLGAGAPSPEEAARVTGLEREAQRLAADIDHCRAELAGLGLTCLDVAHGVVVFPSDADAGAPAGWVWQPGEPTVRPFRGPA